MSESDASSKGGKEKLSSKVLSGIATSGKKVASGGSSVVSGIKSSTEKVASSGSKAISGIASSGNKAVHTITSPIGSAVRQTVDKANNSLHSIGSHSAKSKEQEEDSEVKVSEEEASTGEDGAQEEKPTSETTTGGEGAPEEKPASETTPGAVVASSIEPDAPEVKEKTLFGSVEAATNKLLVNPAKGATAFVAEGGNKLLVKPVKGAAQKVGEGGKAITQRSKEVLHISSNAETSRGLDEDEDEGDLTDVPPDETLSKMNVIINKRLKDMSIADYYAVAWSEGNKTDKDPLYGPWLKESGKQDIIVGEWEFADEGEEFLGDWDGEKYTQKRIVTFVFNKQIPFQIGPTLAKVKHTQYCRVEGKDKCVLAMTIEMSGVPYSDCFNVEIRWVATRSGKSDLAVKVGLFVNFVKSTIMASKIRSGTTEQTMQQQVQLFYTIKQACGTVSEEAVQAPEDEEMPGLFDCSWLTNVFPFMRKDALANRNDEIAISAKSADKKMKEVMTVLADSDPNEPDPAVLDQLVVVNDALDKILAT